MKFCPCGKLLRHGNYCHGHNRLGVEWSEKHKSNHQKAMAEANSRPERRNLSRKLMKKNRQLRMSGEFHHSEEAKNRISELMKGKAPWNKNLKTGQIPWNKGIKCPNISESKMGHEVLELTRQKLSEVAKNQVPWNKGKHYTPEQRAKYENHWQYLVSKCCKRPNKREAQLDQLLQSNFPEEWKYVGNGIVMLGGKCPDWINVNGKKKLIEFFGEYWHRPEDEEIRKLHFKEFGFDTIVIWESELKNEKNLLAKLSN